LMDLYDNIDSLRHTPKLLDKTIFFEDDENIEIAERSEFQDLSNVIDYWKDELPRHNLLPLSADYEISTSDYAEKELTKTACKREKQIDTYQESPGEKTVKFISFYLPQYHPIPENDQWWGKGFTEWTNVAKARPLFQGHYQPHLPADLGFYDLRLPEAREAQAELAKKYGISGFCYYHYWFNGKRLLDYPLQQVLKSGKPDFPFCLCWANENWTRAWHGRQGEILIGQDYSVKDDRNHIKWLLNIFKDKRYIRINNKPLMLIYLTTDLPNAARTTDIWRNEAYKMGEELYLCKVESAPWEYGNPALNGFDASVEFQPDWGKMGSPNGQLDGGHRVFEYEKIVEKMISKPIPPYKRFPCVTPMWDNSPRKKQSAVIFANSTPDLYEKWLSSVISKIDKFNLDENIIFINAWNEWAEGNHLEPDAKNGKSYLYATKKSLSIATSQSNQFSTKFVSIVISTLNQLDYTKACLKSIQKFTEESHEIIFVDNGSTDGTRDFLKNLADSTEHIQLILNETNSGFAAGKNLAIKKAKGDYILILNSDVVVTENWLDRMIQHIEQYPEIGMVGPMSNSASSYQRLKIVPYGDDMNAMHMFAKDYTAANFGKRNNILKLDSFCLLIKKDVFDIIGSLDENYGNGDFEDDDLCLQAAIAGYNSIIAHDVFVHHYNSISLKDNSIDLVTTAEANHQRFREKWQGVVEFNGDEHSVQITKELQLNKLLELGENKFIEGNLRNAVKIFERTLQLDPSNSETLNNLGVIQWQLGAAPSAIKTFQQALSSDPQNSDALYNLVQVAKETGRTDLTSIYLKENDNKVLSDYEDTSGLEKEVYCIWIVNVPGNIHHTFDEIALGLKAAFRKLGFDAPVVTDPDNISGTAIVLGCNRLAKLQISELPENIILYNLEQVQPNSPWLNDNYLELLRSHPVWDYSNINMKELEKIGVTDVTHCGIGYEPELTKIPQIEEDIDVLFYGSINDRRKQILEALKESGLNIVTLFGAYGGKRDEYIARAKIILNIHYYEAKLFEIVRISYLLANKKFIISEPGSDIEFEKIFDGGIVFSKIEDIANDCHKYLKNENFRKAVATKGFEIFKNHSQSDFLKKVIKTH
jgi:GT2 family glycosyltransferase